MHTFADKLNTFLCGAFALYCVIRELRHSFREFKSSLSASLLLCMKKGRNCQSSKIRVISFWRIYEDAGLAVLKN